MPSTVKRAMQELMTNNVARNLKWTGQGIKEGFSKLSLNPILEKAIRKNRATAESTSAEIQHAVAHYLKGAGDRDGGRSQRRARANQVEP